MYTGPRLWYDGTTNQSTEGPIMNRIDYTILAAILVICSILAAVVVNGVF